MKLACNPGKKKLNFRKHTAATAQCTCLLFDYMGDKYDILDNEMEFKWFFSVPVDYFPRKINPHKTSKKLVMPYGNENSNFLK